MPHLDVFALDHDLTGREESLIGALTDAVVAVYGEWVRPSVVVRLFGLASGRPLPAVTFGIRADVFDRPDAETVLNALRTGVAGAVSVVLEAESVSVEFVRA